MKTALIGLTLGLGLVLAGCAHNSPYEPADPLERINRPIYAFNIKADQYVLRPVARSYVKVVPAPARTGVSNFISNFFYPTVVVNDLLQGKFGQSGRDLTRFAMNSTFGLAGFLDPASKVGLMRNDEDFGQTLGRWGVGEGWYLMIPILGPSSNRDLIGWGVDTFGTEPTAYMDLDLKEKLEVAAVRAVDARVPLLSLDHLLKQQLDPYVFVRTAYLQNRLNKVYDGHPPEKLMEPELPE
ncbi:phospholipid-binding lipoprotein MlaA [Solimonas aquatica]|uniref:Phospholipid-binding lipoprotein MlaA n=1 Tax=Solimonas aquatica TaxID=489703 RepID=A0A1H9FVV7_9GAMM|nr:VacJ family lipoprotein [Solimonas aquatica]SEQ42026.1 phospholipid-binding lipoprotein MlaA [Solimonas aquatica]